MYPNHHALLYIGRDSFDVEHFKNERDSTHDVVVQTYAEFRIDDARSLITMATQTPVHLDQQCFVIVADSVAIEAQNALLKLLEEPPVVSSFVFVLPSNTLLATLRSRFMVMDAVTKTATYSPTFQEFISATVPARLTLIASLIEKKNTDELSSLREGLLNYLKEKRRKLTSVQLTRVHWLITQMPLRGASIKMLWEDVTFTLPVEVS